ncbi:hypothetical protein V6615_06585 [Oscillospiraceae bacterium PP1C4]
MKMHDSDDKVIDFLKAKQKKKERLSARKKKKLITLAVLAALIVFVCTVIFLQVSEVVDSKGFWQNFETSQQSLTAK